MGEKVVLKPESLLNLDELLQCPVCYEIPTAQIFQCNEGHHVCGRCKLRLDVCPVCRALFFGTRNYAMEELIANFRNLKSIKLGGKDSAGSASAASGSSDSSTTTQEVISVEPENDTADDDNNGSNTTDEPLRAPPACKGVFRCLCCKSGQSERLPTARLLNHLRYFHAPDLIEGRAENGEYLQAWQFSTSAGRLVTAVRVAEMGVFFLVIEISSDSIYAWLTMASSPWVAQSYNYTITLSGPDREAIFTDSVWSVRSCEGTLKRRGHCLLVTDLDAEALLSAATLGGKLSVRRTPLDHLVNQAPPRAIMRVAHRGLDPTHHDREANAVNQIHAQIEPFLHDLQNDVARITRAFASLDREATAIFGNADMERFVTRPEDADTDSSSPEPVETPQVNPPTIAPAPSAESAAPPQPMSRNARRRMRQRLRAALNETLEVTQHLENQINLRLPDAPQQQVQQVDNLSVNGHSATSSSNGQRNVTHNTNARSARKKRRHRR